MVGDDRMALCCDCASKCSVCGRVTAKGTGWMPQKAVAFLPGGGWLAWYGEKDGTVSSTPVDFWVLTAGGDVNPLSLDAGAFPANPCDDANLCMFTPPDMAKDDAQQCAVKRWAEKLPHYLKKHASPAVTPSVAGKA